MDDNSTYVTILRDSLINKKNVLNNIIELTEKQYELVKQGDVEADVFDEIIEEKGRQLAMLNMMDDGFQSVYNRVSNQLRNNSEQYKDIIIEMQRLIDENIALGAKIETMEHRNKELIEAFIARKKEEIKSYHTKQGLSKSYNMNMANQHVEGTSYFMDKVK